MSAHILINVHHNLKKIKVYRLKVYIENQVLLIKSRNYKMHLMRIKIQNYPNIKISMLLQAY